MRATKKDSITGLCDRLTVDTKELKVLLDCGYVTAVKIGTAAGSKITIGKRVLWNVQKLKTYLDSLTTP